MIEKMRNAVIITCDNADFQQASDIEVYVRQYDLFFQYTPTVTNAHTLVVQIPKSDAMQLTPGGCQMQFAFTDGNGNPNASEIKNLSVADFLKEAGYGT